MCKKMDEATQTALRPLFGEGFLEDHVGRILNDPQIAIVELVANCWDAGAKNVRITWPAALYGKFSISDDGVGMAKDEFEMIWPELRYNRVQKQGTSVKFPDNINDINRTAYGRNGKGRHSLFCFAEEYNIETRRDNSASIFKVIRNKEGESARFAPYSIRFIEEMAKEGNGTIISCNVIKNYLPAERVMEIIGGKFGTDPSFSISVNGHKIALLELKGVDHRVIKIQGEGDVEILRIDSTVSGRTSKQHGVAWWVNNRLVGEHSWKGFDEKYLDGRTSEAKRYTFVVKADILINEVESDWTGFKETERAKRIIEEIKSHIMESVQELLKNSRVSRKRAVLLDHRANLRKLGNPSREHIGVFIDETLAKCPGIGQENLSKVVGILATIEESRTGYRLLNQLSQLSPNDFDKLSEILKDWDMVEVKTVLDELRKRIELIRLLEGLVDNPSADELHELHPLFERGLWIFGQEYEGIKFLSNTSLARVAKEFFGADVVDCPRRRPDIVALAGGSIGFYCSNEYDENGEVCGYNKILIIELKKGGSTITDEAVRQAEDYALAIKRSGKMSPNAKIVCYVLGAKIDCESSKKGETIEVIPRSYSIVLHQASARTFNLIEKIKEAKEIDELSDKEVKDVLEQREITDAVGSEN